MAWLSCFLTRESLGNDEVSCFQGYDIFVASVPCLVVENLDHVTVYFSLAGSISCATRDCSNISISGDIIHSNPVTLSRMYSSMQQARLSVARPCRFVAHRRYPAPFSAPSRRFHLSRRWLASPPQDPHNAESTAPGEVTEDHAIKTDQTPPNGPSVPSPSPDSVNSASKKYGSAVRRAMRNRKSTQQSSIPAAAVPT